MARFKLAHYPLARISPTTPCRVDRVYRKRGGSDSAGKKNGAQPV
jgi:hypothetical protein